MPLPPKRLGLDKTRSNYQQKYSDVFIGNVEVSEKDRVVTWFVNTELPEGAVLGAEIHSPDVDDYILQPLAYFAHPSGDSVFPTYTAPWYPTASVGLLDVDYPNTSVSTTNFRGGVGNVVVGADGTFSVSIKLNDYDNFERVVPANATVYLRLTRPLPSGNSDPRETLIEGGNVTVGTRQGIQMTGGNTNILANITDGVEEPTANGFLSSDFNTRWAGRKITEVSPGNTTINVSVTDADQYWFSNTDLKGYVWMHGVAGGGAGGMGRSDDTVSNIFYAGFGGGAGSYVQRQLKYDQMVDNSNIIVSVGTGGLSNAISNVEATNTTITYNTTTSLVYLNLERGGCGYDIAAPNQTANGGSGAGESWAFPAGTGVGQTAYFTQSISGNDGGADASGVAQTLDGIFGDYNSGGGGGGANGDGGDATYSTQKGGAGGSAQLGAAYTLSLAGNYPNHLDNINRIFPLAEVHISQGGSGGGRISGDLNSPSGVNIAPSAGVGGNATVSATSAITGSGSGGGGAGINRAPGSNTFLEGGTGGDGSFAISYRAAWRIFVKQ